MPAIPDPSRISLPEPEPQETTRIDWNAPSAVAKPGELYATPPDNEWPVFRALPERRLTPQAVDEPDFMYRSRRYVAACYWANEDAKAGPTPEQREADKRTRNAEAVARHREKKRREELAALTPEEQAWSSEVSAIDVYTQGIDARVQQLKAERSVAVARRAELCLLLAQRKRERDRK